MVIKHLLDCIEFTAGDKSRLREIFNPKKDALYLHYSLAWAMVKPHERTLPHRLKFSEVYYIIKGTGKMHIDDEKREIAANDIVYIPPRAIQYLENTAEENLEFLCIVDPAWEPTAEEILSASNEG